jgi:hypothetical protein
VNEMGINKGFLIFGVKTIEILFRLWHGLAYLQKKPQPPTNALVTAALT